jgi:hypothetical protein
VIQSALSRSHPQLHDILGEYEIARDRRDWCAAAEHAAAAVRMESLNCMRGSLQVCTSLVLCLCLTSFCSHFISSIATRFTLYHKRIVHQIRFLTPLRLLSSRPSPRSRLMPHRAIRASSPPSGCVSLRNLAATLFCASCPHSPTPIQLTHPPTHPPAQPTPLTHPTHPTHQHSFMRTHTYTHTHTHTHTHTETHCNSQIRMKCGACVGRCLPRPKSAGRRLSHGAC